jgi:hypothetical protein
MHDGSLPEITDMSLEELQEGYPQPPLEVSIDRIELHVAIGQWRGRLKVAELVPPNALLLFAKDDGAPLAWGRALEELLENLLVNASGGTP